MSSTRAGTVYTGNEIENRNGATLNEDGDGRTMVEEVNGEGVADVMRMLMEERQRREAEREEERRKWEMEMRMRDEEMARREEYNQRQMEVLQSLVRGVQLQGEAAVKRAEGDKDVKVPKLTEEDDIVAYLTTFERLMTAYEIKQERWVFKLASNLVGKAQQAYAGLSTEDASSYDRLKEAILQRYDITEESYR